MNELANTPATRDLHKRVLQEPEDCINAFQAALNDHLDGLDDGSKQDRVVPPGDKVLIGFDGEFGYHRVSPRELGARHISKLVNVIGIVTKCSLVCPKLQKGVFYCEATGTFEVREYRDVTATSGKACSRCVCAVSLLLLPLSTAAGLYYSTYLLGVWTSCHLVVCTHLRSICRSASALHSTSGTRAPPQHTPSSLAQLSLTCVLKSERATCSWGFEC